jgi:formylglycine-generating enzyme required for sulfatase activity
MHFVFTALLLIYYVVSQQMVVPFSDIKPADQGIFEISQNLPEVKTTGVKQVGITDATVSCEFGEAEGVEVKKKGVCWNRKGNPTVEDSIIKIKEGTGAGAFECQLIGLVKATVYHARAFTITEEEVVYGEEVSFSTHAFANGVQISLKYVQGGTFQMGATRDPELSYGDELPVHQVGVNAFQISQNEITSSQYCAFLNDRGIERNGRYQDVLYIDILDSDCPVRYAGSQFVPEKGKGRYPVSEVTWFGAHAFCEWMGGRLPSEAEWEFAARGGSKSNNYKYSGSDILDEVAWYKGNSNGHAHPVGQKAPNELGLYDMSGNVWEWCHDWYGFDYYGLSPDENPMGPSKGSSRVMRGGAWNMDEWNCRVSNRSSKIPGITYNYYGIRLLIPSE